MFSRVRQTKAAAANILNSAAAQTNRPLHWVKTSPDAHVTRINSDAVRMDKLRLKVRISEGVPNVTVVRVVVRMG